MPESDNHQLTQLRRQIEEHFDEEELRSLCFDLGVDFENLGGRGKAANVLEMVSWARRHGRLSDLMALVKSVRPNVPDVVALLPPHHIPYHKNELFTGRGEWLTALHTGLNRDKTVAVTLSQLKSYRIIDKEKTYENSKRTIQRLFKAPLWRP